MSRFLEDHEEFLEYKCNYLCEREKKVRRSHQFCPDCTRHLCTECNEVHRALYKTHKLVSPEDSPLNLTANAIEEHCHLHPTKIAELFCSSHDAVICTACLKDHQSCKAAVYIPQNVNNLLSPSTIQKICEKLADHGAKLDKMGSLTNKLEKNDILSRKKIEMIKTYTSKLRSIVNDLEKKAIIVVENEGKIVSDILRENASKEDALKSEVKTSLENLLNANNNNAQSFVCLKKAQKLVSKTAEFLSDRYKVLDVSTFWDNYHINESLKHELATSSLISSTRRPPMSRTYHTNITEQRLPRNRNGERDYGEGDYTW